MVEIKKNIMIWFFLISFNNFRINFNRIMVKIKGKGAKLATVNFQMDNFDTRKLDGAKLYIINQNGTNLATPLS